MQLSIALAAIFLLLNVLLGCGKKSAEIGAPPFKTIYEAASRGDCAAIRQFLDAGGSVGAREADEYGLTPLLHAASKGQTDAVRLLLDRGASPNEADRYGNSALSYAAAGGVTQTAALLLDRGGEINPLKGERPLDEAKKYLHKPMVDLLRRRGADCPPSDNLYDAINNWDTEAVKMFIKKGVSVHEPDDDDLSDLPLHHAARCGFVDIAELLVAAGADVNARPSSKRMSLGGTPLHDAVFWGKTAMVEFLLKHGADPNAKNDYGHSPIWRLPGGRGVIYDLLIKYGAKPPEDTK